MAAKSTKSKTTGKKTNTTAKKPSSNKKTTRKTTRKTTGKRKTAGRKSTGNGNSFLIDEILIWTTLAVSIILLISNFGIAGFLGDAISGFLWNVFGVAAYVIPFILFGLVSFLISNKDNRNAYVKSLIGVILLVLAEVLLHLIDDMGGKIGKSVASVLTPAIGVAGTYVITIIFMIICLVIITGKSALRGVKAGSDKAYARAREDARRHKELAEERKRERMEQRTQRERERAEAEASGTEKRRDKHVEGVSFDTSIAKKSPEVRELPIDPKTAKGPEKPEFVIHRADPEPEASDTADTAVAGTEPVKNAAESAAGTAPEEKPTRRKNPKMGAAGMADEVADVAASVAADSTKPKKAYKCPPLSLLQHGKRGGGESDAHLRETAMKLQQTLENFGVNVTITNVSCGPSVTRYELQPEMGVKVSKIVGLADDIKLNLAAADIRIEAPIPGKAAVGIEVPNAKRNTVTLRELLESPEFINAKSNVTFAVGKDIGGKTIVTDIAKMPHMLIAGATGSGKSVCINTLIMSILYKANPNDVKFIMVDPKMVELTAYADIPHMLIPVVTDPKKASAALNWAVQEMTVRYEKFAALGVRDIKSYNKKIAGLKHNDDNTYEKMCQIVIVVDEFADLMMVASNEVEDAVCRLAQLARAAGIHLVLATQRPSVNVITGLIKANIPSRIALSVSSAIDSRTIIDGSGAEKLLGNGDMLFAPQDYPKPVRVQGAFVSDEERNQVVAFLKEHMNGPAYNEEISKHIEENPVGTKSAGASGAVVSGPERDELFVEAAKFIIEKDKASIGMLQRVFRIGFNRAARIMDQLSDAGVVGPEEGTKPRVILMSMEQFENYLEEEG